jgi:hypothetical protein
LFWVDFFPGPGGGLVGTHDGAVDAEQIPVDTSVGLGAGLEVSEDAVPQAVLAPGVEARVDGFPGSEKLRQVAPGGAGVQNPEDAVDHQSVVLGWSSRPVAGWEEGAQDVPLGITQAVSRSLHGS